MAIKETTSKKKGAATAPLLDNAESVMENKEEVVESKETAESVNSLQYYRSSRGDFNTPATEAEEELLKVLDEVVVTTNDELTQEHEEVLESEEVVAEQTVCEESKETRIKYVGSANTYTLGRYKFIPGVGMSVPLEFAEKALGIKGFERVYD